jgi:protease IV
MSFTTISAILRGRWLLDRQWAEVHLPVVAKILVGESVTGGNIKKEQLETKSSYQMSGVQPVYYSTDLSKIPEGSIAIIKIAGPLLKYGDMCSYGMIDKAGLIGSAASSPNISAIILDVDSPGGQVEGTSMLSDTIVRAKQRKPVVAVVDDGMAASAAMWIASSANELYVTQRTDQVGSIGVYCTLADWPAHYKDYYKLPTRQIYAPQSTAKNINYREAIQGNDEPITEELRVICDEFIKAVKRNRGSRLSGSEWSTGRMFYAKEAMKVGLIDGIKTFEQVVQRTKSLIKN